uniref:Uncharacterized protein n=1 Tax=Arundo donax TaxID=35708 RepID=A0A0A9B6Y7_ARUDO
MMEAKRCHRMLDKLRKVSKKKKHQWIMMIKDHLGY